MESPQGPQRHLGGGDPEEPSHTHPVHHRLLSGPGPVEQLFTHVRELKRTQEFDLPLHMGVVDLETDCDIVPEETPW